MRRVWEMDFVVTSTDRVATLRKVVQLQQLLISTRKSEG